MRNRALNGGGRRVWRNTGYERFRFQRKAATENDLDVFEAVRNEKNATFVFVLNPNFHNQQRVFKRSCFVAPLSLQLSWTNLKLD